MAFNNELLHNMIYLQSHGWLHILDRELSSSLDLIIQTNFERKNSVDISFDRVKPTFKIFYFILNFRLSHLRL